METDPKPGSLEALLYAAWLASRDALMDTLVQADATKTDLDTYHRERFTRWRRTHLPAPDPDGIGVDASSSLPRQRQG